MPTGGIPVSLGRGGCQLETIMNISDGLNLDGGVDAWKVSKEGIYFVKEKLKELIPTEVEKYTQPKVLKPKMR